MKKLPLRLLLTLGALGLAGCDLGNLIPPAQPDPTRYFLLAAAPEAPGELGHGHLRVGLKHIELAAFLRARSMMVRRGANEIEIEDFDRWAEPLDDGIARVLRSRLLRDPSVGAVAKEPFAFDAERDYDVAVTVIHCEGAIRADGSPFVSFAATFDISSAGADPRAVVHRVYFAPDIPWDGRDYDKLAAALSTDVDGLAGEIVSALNAAPTPPVPAP